MKILYIDMDNVLVDFNSGIGRLSQELLIRYKDHYDDAPGVFGLMDPIPGALDAFHLLAQHFDTFILSTAPWHNPSAWSDKPQWVQRYLGKAANRRLILTHRKDLNRGDYLVDDQHKWGAVHFIGEWIQFGSPEFPDWETVTAYLLPRA